MKFTKMLAAIALCIAATWAADLTVQRAQMYGPNGAVDGKLVMLGDRMIFVDDQRPEMSFVIPRADVRTARVENGRLSIDLRNPYSSSLGASQSSLVLGVTDPQNAGTIVSWMGVPVSGWGGESSRQATTQVTEVRFDVRNGDQRGQLLVMPDELRFESLSDARHSAHWAYSDIRELTHNDHEIKIQPFHGDKYQFQFSDAGMLDTAYRMLSDKVVGARVNR